MRRITDINNTESLIPFKLFFPFTTNRSKQKYLDHFLHLLLFNYFIELKKKLVVPYYTLFKPFLQFIMINRWIENDQSINRYDIPGGGIVGNWNREYLVKVEAWNRIVYPIGVQAAVHLGGFSGLNRGLQSSRRVPRGIAVGTRSSFHYVRPLQPEECPAAVVRVASLSVWKQQRPLYVRTIWTIIRSSFFLSLYPSPSYPYSPPPLFPPLNIAIRLGNELHQRVVRRWLSLNCSTIPRLDIDLAPFNADRIVVKNKRYWRDECR